MEAPCKDCRERFENCHTYCSEYYLFKMHRKRVSMKKQKEVASMPELSKAVERRIWKEKRRHG